MDVFDLPSGSALKQACNEGDFDEGARLVTCEVAFLNCAAYLNAFQRILCSGYASEPVFGSETLFQSSVIAFDAIGQMLAIDRRNLRRRDRNRSPFT